MSNVIASAFTSRHHIVVGTIALGVALATLATPASAETKRQLTAHEHGAGVLDIAIEGTKVVLALEAPGHDIVGFEHAAKTTAQKAAIEKAKGTLAGGLSLFKLPANAGCKLITASVAHNTDGHDEKPAASGKSDAHASHGKAKDADHARKETSHSEFVATYTLECASPEKITSITFDYFKTFSKAAKLTVTVVSDKGQRQYVATRKAPRLTLGAGS